MSRFKRAREAAKEEQAADYMDESFLAVEIAPSAQRRPKEPRTAVVLSKKEVQIAMVEKREEGLKTALGADNRGFNLLAKMGYKGGGLGKDGSGAVAPIKPVIKTCRSGLGKEAEKRRSEDLKQTLLQRMRAARARGAEQRQHDFRAAKSRQFRDKRAAGDLARVRRLIETFDSAAGILASAMWPGEPEDAAEETRINAESGNSSGGGSSGAGSAVAAAASSGRSWHEEKHPDEAAHEAAAGGEPVGERQAAAIRQQQEEEEAGAVVAAVEAAERLEWAALDPSEQLGCCLGYLRNTYLHCAFCGITFESAEDMVESCPGPLREDHDDDD